MAHLILFEPGVDAIAAIRRPADMRVLQLLLKTGEGASLTLTAETRASLLTTLNMSASNFSATLSRLKKLGIITGRGSDIKFKAEYVVRETNQSSNDQPIPPLF